MRISEQTRRQTEQRIRAAIDRLLGGELPPGGKCDVKTLAAEADVTRASLYTTYLHLKEEFEQRRNRLQDQGRIADPREAQIARLTAENTALRQRIAERDALIAELTRFKTLAVSRLAVQHQEIERLRTTATRPDNVRDMPTRQPAPVTGPCS